MRICSIGSQNKIRSDCCRICSILVCIVLIGCTCILMITPHHFCVSSSSNGQVVGAMISYLITYLMYLYLRLLTRKSITLTFIIIRVFPQFIPYWESLIHFISIHFITHILILLKYLLLNYVSHGPFTFMHFSSSDRIKFFVWRNWTIILYCWSEVHYDKLDWW